VTAAWAAVIGIGGTLLGTITGGLLAIFNDSRKWKRDQHARWASERRALYAAVIAECEHVVEEITFGKSLEGRTLGQINDDIAPVWKRLQLLIADLELIGTDEDAAAARALFSKATRFMEHALRSPDAPVAVALEEWSSGLADFRRRARAGFCLHLEGSA
jgi:hypothetical protein